jgi:hypothetical protein
MTLAVLECLIPRNKKPHRCGFLSTVLFAVEVQRYRRIDSSTGPAQCVFFEPDGPALLNPFEL